MSENLGPQWIRGVPGARKHKYTIKLTIKRQTAITCMFHMCFHIRIPYISLYPNIPTPPTPMVGGSGGGGGEAVGVGGGDIGI